MALYTTDDPATGKWTKLREFPYYADPELYVDDDGKIHLYWGSSPDQPIFGIELDPEKNYEPIGQPVPLIAGLDTVKHGWEARNQLDSDEQIRDFGYKPWMEGATVIKKDGVYYLQYSAPGTEMPEYADGVYTASKSLGPYTYAPYSPFSCKPTGFITSAGHGSTFRDERGRAWRVVSQLVGVNFMFERRLGLFPVGFATNGDEPAQIAANTYLGDYPQLAPKLVKSPSNNLAGWMLVSLKKPATASSSLDADHGPERAFDEDIRTSWAAATGALGEFLQVDFGKPCRIDSVQINFADVNSTAHGFTKDSYRYAIEVSDDGESWKPLVDRRDSKEENSNPYIQLPAPVTARHEKLTNVHTPTDAVFSVSGLRFFGSGLGENPGLVTGVKAERQENKRLMKVSWDQAPGADFYIVRYGIKPDRLTLNRQVYDGESVLIPGLNTDQQYFVTVDAVNDSGITKGANAKPASN